MRAFPAPADLLGEALHLFRLAGMLYCRAELSAPWGVEVPQLPGFMTFQVITTGRCRLEIGDAEPRELRGGSVTLIPHGTPHIMRSSPGVATEPLFDLPVELISERYEIMRHGGGGEPTHVTYGVVQFDHPAAQRLVAQLPEVLQIDTWDDEDATWLQSTLRLIGREAVALRPGGETVITRLADVLVIQAIRSWLDTAPEANEGWLAALRDDQIGQALLWIHRAPEREWTVAALAQAVGMSRSAFSARFTELVGESAMRYLAVWRMQLAREHLRHSSEPMSAVARRFGYQSEAAFCRAFKREFGVPPGGYRQARAVPRTTAALQEEAMVRPELPPGPADVPPAQRSRLGRGSSVDTP